ncbi:MAG: collagen-like protein [Xenococcaceae cyanobacterium MO_188.B19]|nr:collagen-like protein [Xenococcaceae cyanobacterium MO_188.B19]
MINVKYCAISYSGRIVKFSFHPMQARFLGKLSLAIAFLAIPQFTPTTANSILCSSALRAEEITDFGNQGAKGVVGARGENGRNSDSLTVFADGSPMTLDLSGENGFPGENGTDGKPAICGEIAEDAQENLQAANGGNGGDGGDGGNGGNGGALTIYTTDKSYLQDIYVVASGGAGGTGGAGGAGGAGCECPTSYWNQQTCTGKPGSSKYSCTTREYQCRDGFEGRSGRDGRNGRNGRLGVLTLINLDKSLAPDQPQATITLAQLKDRGFTLSQNEWETRTGAASLLAPGSIIADQYQELIARHEHTVLLVWDAPQPVTDFAGQRVTLKLQGEDSASVTFPENMWLETSELARDNITEIFVFNAVLENDVTRLKSEGISGIGENLKISLVDRAKRSNVISTDFKVKYRVSKSGDEARFRRVFDYRTKYEGEIPASLIEQNGDRFTINIGKLPMPSEFLQPETAIEIQLTANRAFAGNSKQQKITVRDVIKR